MKITTIPNIRMEATHQVQKKDDQRLLTPNILTQDNAESPTPGPSVKWPKPCSRLLAFLSFGAILFVTVAVGVSRLKAKPTVHVTFPARNLNRQVRMFSDFPDLDALSRNHSSLSLVSRLQLLDAQRCRHDIDTCKISVVCDSGTKQKLNCRCRTGFYFQDYKCRACSTSCPAGHFMQSSCTEDTDVVCRPCKLCSATEYTAAACSTTMDTTCIDVSFPTNLLLMNRTNLPDDHTLISVDHSRNVFMERLVDEGVEHSEMQFPNNQQEHGLEWRRMSGLRIGLSVTGVFLVPEYREFGFGNPSEDLGDSNLFPYLHYVTSSVKQLYDHTLKHYCRYPVPDFYKLALEVSKDRLSAAKSVKCKSEDWLTGRCKKGAKEYLIWDINKPCPYQKTPMKPITQVKNNLVCLEETPLLKNIFQRYRANTGELKFTAPACSNANKACMECVNRSGDKSTCSLFGNSNQNGNTSDSNFCCSVGCYNQEHCKLYYNKATCPEAKVLCATGDVHVFSVTPQYPAMSEEFSCYLQYQPPPHLYRVSYSIRIPSLNFNFPTKTHTVNFKSRRQHTIMTTWLDFLKAEHQTGFLVDKDMILSGKHFQLKRDEAYKSIIRKYEFRRLKSRQELSQLKNFNLERNGLLTQVIPEKPFEFSSSSWSDFQCQENTSMIFPKQPYFKSDILEMEGTQRYKTILTSSFTSKKTDFSYELYNTYRKPMIRLRIEEGASVLQHLQGQAGVTGILDANSLDGRVTWHYETSTWMVQLTGDQLHCPSIVSIKIFTQMVTGCAGHFDVFIDCPLPFSIIFNLTAPLSNLPDIFVLQINDSATSHRMVLSSMYAPLSVEEARSESVHVAKEEKISSTNSDHEENFVGIWLPLLMAVFSAVSILVAIVVAYHCVNTRARRVDLSASIVGQEAEKIALNNHNEKQNHSPNVSVQTPKTRWFIYLFVLLYVCYSLIFSFSLTSTIIYLSYRSSVEEYSHPTRSGSELRLKFNDSIHQIEKFEHQERLRLFSAFEERRKSCKIHLEKENKKLLKTYQETTQKQVAVIFQENGTLHKLTNVIQRNNVSMYMSQIDQFVSDCNKTVDSILQGFEDNFYKFLRNALHLGWMKVPREIFMKQVVSRYNQRAGSSTDRPMTSSSVKRFALWLGIQNVGELLAARDNVVYRIQQVPIPTVTSADLTFPSVTPDLDTSFPEFQDKPHLYNMIVTGSSVAKSNQTFQTHKRVSRSAGSLSDPSEFGFSGNVQKPAAYDKLSGMEKGDNEHNIPSNKDYDYADDEDADEDSYSKYDKSHLYSGFGDGSKTEKHPKYNLDKTSHFAQNFDNNLMPASNLNPEVNKIYPYNQQKSVQTLPLPVSSYSSSPNEDKDADSDSHSQYLYLLIGVFITLDVFLWMYRISWLSNQLYAAKNGYADRIPTDDACKQVLEIQTAYHLPAFDGSLENMGTYVDGKEHLYGQEQETENMTFLQPLPNTKNDDVLQQIWNEKTIKAEDNWAQRSCISRFYRRLRELLQRIFLSQLVWQACVTFLAVLFICLLLYAVEFWLVPANFRSLVGSQSATRDVLWELDTSGRYLHGLARQLTLELARIRRLCDMEVATLTDAYFSTVNTQTSAFSMTIQHLCQEAKGKNCERLSSLLSPAGGRIVGCNFLPLQAQTFHDLGLSNIEELVSGEVTPFLQLSKRVISTSSLVIISMLCVRLLCQVAATTVRHYLLLTGRLPRVKVYQSEELPDGVGGVGEGGAMQRSQSWVDSCESGVYVGEGEDANREDASKMVVIS